MVAAWCAALGSGFNSELGSTWKTSVGCFFPFTCDPDLRELVTRKGGNVKLLDHKLTIQSGNFKVIEKKALLKYHIRLELAT